MINQGKLLNRLTELAQNKMNKFGKVWQTQSKITAPLGYTGQLKRSLKAQPIDDKKPRGIRLTSDKKYAIKQNRAPLTHVPKGEVGRKSWVHYGRGLPAGRSISRTRKALYYRGLNWAHQNNYPQYLHNYAREGYKLGGGIRTLRKIMRARL